MRVLVVTHTYALEGGGGGEVFLGHLLRGLAARGHRVLVVAPKGRSFEAQERALGIEVVRTPNWGHHALHKYWQVVLARRALARARRFQPDLVHAHNDVFSALAAWQLAAALGVPFLVNVEYLSAQAASLNMKAVFWLNRLLLARLPFAHLTCWSRHVIDRYLVPWGIPRARITLVPPAVDTRLYRPGAGGGALKKAFPGPLVVAAKPLHATNARGLAVVMRAMKKVREKVPEARFLLYGDGTHRKKLEALAARLGLEDTVVFGGQVPPEKVAEAYAAADVAAHAFAFEATASIALLESMAAGCAVVATDTGEVRRVVDEAALLVEKDDADAMARAITRLLRDARLRRRLGEKAAALVRERYSVESAVKRFEEVYARVLEAPDPAPPAHKGNREGREEKGRRARTHTAKGASKTAPSAERARAG